MAENSRGAAELNRTQQKDAKLEEVLQELYNVETQLDTLELPKGFKPISIAKYKELTIADNIKEKDVFAVELENEEQERQTQLYKKLSDEKLHLIATINAENEVQLSKEHQERYASFMSREELQTPYPISKKEMEKEAVAQIEPNEKRKDGKTSQERAIAVALGIPADRILNVIEVKDENAMANATNRNVDRKDIFLVKLKQSTAENASNDYVMVEQKADGSFEVASKTDMSQMFQEITDGLGIKDTRQKAEIKEGDIEADANPYDKTRHVEVNQYHFKDDTRYILSVKHDYKTQMHVYKEENGKLVPLCTRRTWKT